MDITAEHEIHHLHDKLQAWFRPRWLRMRWMI